MNTPLGQVRIDLGFNEEGNYQTQFSMGKVF
jgi:hypothetical protein